MGKVSRMMKVNNIYRPSQFIITYLVTFMEQIKAVMISHLVDCAYYIVLHLHLMFRNKIEMCFWVDFHVNCIVSSNFVHCCSI